MNPLTPEQFAQHWADTTLQERQSYQIHFADVCHLVGFPTPSASGKDERGKTFVFEYGAKKDSGAQGFADVFYEGHFAIEYKGINKHKDLTAAYRQLQQYRENLNNPPLLVVCDIAHWEIHTNFTNTVPKVYRFTNAEIVQPEKLRWLRDLFHHPDALRPDRDTEQVTKEAAAAFQFIVDNMRQEWQAEPDRIARFLTKLVFCLFAEDVGLLPQGLREQRGIFSEIVEQTRHRPDDFARYMRELFGHMANGGSMFMRDIPYFDGLLFEDVEVIKLGVSALNELDKASHLDWSSVQPAIFGTLFERSLDPGKRAQLGAHYTSRDDILLIVEPVLMQPLRRQWEAIRAQAAPVRAAYDSAATPRARNDRVKDLLALREQMLNRLRAIRVLDPACGSGNFLYVALQLLMDLEKTVINDPLWAGLQLAYPEVHPRQLYGIEINPIAHALSSIVVWIGYIQWRQTNGYWMGDRQPILEPLEDNILHMDAIMQIDASGQPFEPQWPDADVIVGNPPFLGAKKIVGELGQHYANKLRELYKKRILGGADLVTYWFEKGRTALEKGKTNRVGLLATNSIRDGASRQVVEQIQKTGNIFMAWSDREWILEGAAVRVSMIAFDLGEEPEIILDGRKTIQINSDLTAGIDVTVAQLLSENADLASRGFEPGGPFDLTEDEASNLQIDLDTPIIVPVVNAKDLTGRPRKAYLIDFEQTPERNPHTYEAVFNLLQGRWNQVAQDPTKRPIQERPEWWKFRRSGEKTRILLNRSERYICTPVTSKHRFFVWLRKEIFPTNLLVLVARDDDYFFGVLHSRLHEVWSLRMGTSLEDRPRYTPTTTFETFPFPWPPGQEDTAHPAYAAISAAAKALHEARDAWLNPPGLPESRLKQRTLTNLYNALEVFRGQDKSKVVPDAGDFAPRLADLHDALDRAVCDAYGWPHETLQDDEAILGRLLALNLERAAQAK